MSNNGQTPEPALGLAGDRDLQTDDSLVAALEALAQVAPEPNPEADTPSQADIAGAFAKALAPLNEKLTGLGDQVRELQSVVEQGRIQNHVVAEMHDRCRELSEQHHEREVLGPVLHSLIGQVERCRQQRGKLADMYDRHAEQGNQAALLAMRMVLDWRKGDMAEIEGILATFGVEPFQSSSDDFDPSCQTCLQRIDTNQPERAGHIAERLQPGYRRGDWILRRECVAVSIGKPARNRLTKGEEQ